MRDDLTNEWGYIQVQGKLVPAGEAIVSAFDRGFLYGDGVFETVRVYSGKPFMLDAHFERMALGCSIIGLQPPEFETLKEDIPRLLEANQLQEAYLRITVTRGATGRIWYDTSTDKQTVVMIARRFERPDFGDGIRMTVSRFRADERSPLTGVKRIGILEKIVARKEAIRAGFDDALMMDTRACVAEATSSNVFWVRENTLFTPALSCGILPGITRRVVIEIAHAKGLRVNEGEFQIEEINTAEEMFLTSSTWEIAPVRCIDGKEFAVCTETLTAQLARAYQEMVLKGCSNAD